MIVIFNLFIEHISFQSVVTHFSLTRQYTLRTSGLPKILQSSQSNPILSISLNCLGVSFWAYLWTICFSSCVSLSLNKTLAFANLLYKSTIFKSWLGLPNSLKKSIDISISSSRLSQHLLISMVESTSIKLLKCVSLKVYNLYN